MTIRFRIKKRKVIPYIPVFLGLLVIFPIQYEAVLSGFDGVGKEEREALRLEGGERSFLALRQVYGPGALPYLLLSFAQSLGLGLKVILTDGNGNHLNMFDFGS